MELNLRYLKEGEFDGDLLYFQADLPCIEESGDIEEVHIFIRKNKIDHVRKKQTRSHDWEFVNLQNGKVSTRRKVK